MAADPPEDLELFLALTLAASKAWTIVQREFRAEGVEAGHWGVLSHIAAHDAATPSQLAAEMGITSTTMRDQLQSLVERGSITRTPNPLDARSYYVALTAQGRRELTRGLRASRRAHDAVAAEFGPLEDLRRELLRFGRAADAVNAAEELRERAVRVRAKRS
jgi:DNA-binding MarR family transcriptional regulator